MAKRVSEYDQFQVRLPEGLRGRIRTAADENNRSMNAEIVATLEEKYPPPQPLYSRRNELDLNIGYLSWYPKDQDWLIIDGDIWDSLKFKNFYPLGVNGTKVGINYFLVLVFNDIGVLVNIVPHMYKIDDTGRVIGNVFDVLSSEERDEYAKFYTRRITSPAEDAWFREMQDKMTPFLLPSLIARIKLRRFLQERLPIETVDAALEKAGLSPL